MEIINRILHFIKRKRLTVPIIIGLVCAVMYFKSSSGIDPFTSNADLYRTGTRNLFVILWLFLSGIYLMYTYYSDKTGGRNYIIDKLRYDRSYFDLINVYKDAEPYKMNVDALPKEDWRNSEGIIMGRVDGRLIKRSAFENGGEGVNVGVFGRPGTGKTAAELIITALVYGGSIFTLDIKGDILAATKNHRSINIFSPADPLNSCHYNPLAGITMMSRTKRNEFIEGIAAILIPKERDRYWYQTARSIFCGVSLYLLHENPSTTLPDIATAILLKSAPEWITKIKESDCVEAQVYTNSLYRSSETNLQGAYGTLATAVRPFHDQYMSELLRETGDVLSPIDLEAGFDIYVELPQESIDTYAPLVTIMVQDFMNYFMRREDKSSGKKQQPVLFMLDEFPQLNFEYETVHKALSTLRSKCVSVMLAMQSISQLTDKYGDSACTVIIDTCSYFTILSAQDPKSRKFFSELIGKRKVLKLTSGGSSEDREYVFQDGDFSNLGENVIVYALGKYILAEKIYWFKEFDGYAPLSSPQYTSGMSWSSYAYHDDRTENDFLVDDDFLSRH